MEMVVDSAESITTESAAGQGLEATLEADTGLDLESISSMGTVAEFESLCRRWGRFRFLWRRVGVEGRDGDIERAF